MEYTKQNFIDLQTILKAEHLQHIESGIDRVHQALTGAEPVLLDLGNGYFLKSELIEEELYKASVGREETTDEFNIFEIKAPSAQPHEATLALMCDGDGTVQFVDISCMRYDNTQKGTFEIVIQKRGATTPLPDFIICFNDGAGAGRVKKFIVEPDAIPVFLTAQGLKVRKNNNYDNTLDDGEWFTLNLEEVYNVINGSGGGALAELYNAVTDVALSFNQYDRKISLLPTGNSYQVYYANSSGNPIEDYAPVKEFTLALGGEKSEYTGLIALNIAPVSATQLVTRKNGAAANLSTAALDSGIIYPTAALGARKYRFGLLSDVHVNGLDTDETDWSMSQTDFARCLSWYREQKVNMIAIAGDLVEAGDLATSPSDFAKFNELVTNFNTGATAIPVRACRGNHDCYAPLSTFTTYADPGGLYFLLDSSVSGYEFLGNDVFIFAGLSDTWTRYDPFSTEELAWLKEKLDANRNKRVFFVFHLPIPPVGVGGDIYRGQVLKIDSAGSQAAAIWSLLTHYKNVISLNGHTHMDFKYQEVSEIHNIKDNSESCSLVHIPSAAYPRIADYTDGYGTLSVAEGSQGYLVDVYENHVVFYGRDFASGKMLPIATYCLDTTLQEIATLIPTLGVNLVNFTTERSATKGGVTLTYNVGATISVNGTATEAGTFYSDNLLTPGENPTSIITAGGKYALALSDISGNGSTADTTDYLLSIRVIGASTETRYADADFYLSNLTEQFLFTVPEVINDTAARFIIKTKLGSVFDNFTATLNISSTEEVLETLPEAAPEVVPT